MVVAVSIPVRTGLSSEEAAQRIRQAFASFPRFCGLLKIPPKGGGPRIPLLLSPIQRAYNAARTSRDIILKPRQVYMTTLEAARDVWWFLTKPGARVVVVCQSQTDQAALKDLAYKFRIFFDSLRQLGIQLPFGVESTTEWTLPDRDATLRIIQAGASEASASKKGRGGTVNRLHISEAAFFERAEDTFNSLMESVPREGSEVVNESTPNGASGFYYEQWRASVEGRSGYTPHFFPWWHHPEYRLPLDEGETFEPETSLESQLLDKGVPPECLNWYRWKVRDKGGNADLVAQEFPSDPDTCFLVSGRTFFDIKLISESIGTATDPIAVEDHDCLHIWAYPRRGSEYVISADPAEGGGGDPSAALVYERGTGAHVATLHGQFIPWDLAAKLAILGKRYNSAQLVPERNNHGHAVIQSLQRKHRYPHIYRHTDGKLGWLTNEPSRALMLDELDAAHRRKSWKTQDRLVLAQMRTFIVGATGKPAAAPGEHDDLIMAAAIGWAVATRSARVRTELGPQQPEYAEPA